MRTQIDTSFDFRSDTPPGKDPDALSPTLRRYHQLLWSKPLPGGRVFSLSDTRKGAYLYHGSDLGEFILSSDSAINGLKGNPKVAKIREQLPPAELELFRASTYTIGGMIIFPGNRVDGKSTINAARGFHPKIKDRFDLTLECIRRYYVGQTSPLKEVLSRYSSFFGIFGDFKGYVEFFLLHDLVEAELDKVRFMLPFDDFRSSPVPQDQEAYVEYMRRCMSFIAARNSRISSWLLR